MTENTQAITGFVEWLSAADVQIVLSYWSPFRNELMPITYVTEDLVSNYAKGKPPISGKVKAVR